jgi:hypothetical protein
LIVNIALRREVATLEYYRAGSAPDAVATLPKEWTIDQIKQFQDYFDALMAGNLGHRRRRTTIERFLASLRDIGHNR